MERNRILCSNHSREALYWAMETWVFHDLTFLEQTLSSMKGQNTLSHWCDAIQLVVNKPLNKVHRCVLVLQPYYCSLIYWFLKIHRLNQAISCLQLPQSNTYSQHGQIWETNRGYSASCTKTIIQSLNQNSHKF